MPKQETVEPVKLIAGFLYSRDDILMDVLEKMEAKFGRVEFESERFSFSHSEYYKKEMGPELTRYFASFEEPVTPDKLRQFKQTTIKLEQKYLGEGGGRQVNIDPGLVSLGNLVLASTKEFAHRVYLGGGIYAEVSMIYQNGSFRTLPWTYPDYQRDETIRFMNRVRDGLKEHIILLRQKEQ
jgi:hypothetical protein